MKNVLNNLVTKERKVKQKVMKTKYREDGKIKKVVERETEYHDNMPNDDYKYSSHTQL